MHLPEAQLIAACVHQVGGLLALAHTYSAELTHLKPHGALYNQACRDQSIARVIATVASHFRLPLLGLPNSEMERACADKVEYIREGFADRRYRSDGSLVPRAEPNPFVVDSEEAANQVEELIAKHGVRSFCVHGDSAHAVEFVRGLKRILLVRGHTIGPFA